MRMAGAAVLPVRKVGLLQVPEPVYVDERSDRSFDPLQLRPDTGAQPPAVQRLHIIDACQLLNKSRLLKPAGATVDTLREAIERTGDTLALPQRVFRWRVFNLLVANDGCHLKNLSCIVQANTITLAPHYDLLATGFPGRDPVHLVHAPQVDGGDGSQAGMDRYDAGDVALRGCPDAGPACVGRLVVAPRPPFRCLASPVPLSTPSSRAAQAPSAVARSAK